MGNGQPQSETWKTKSTDRFVLKRIKCHLSARITPRLIRHGWLRPWMITVVSVVLGMVGGGIYALGVGWFAGLIAACAQMLDGVDGQFARRNGVNARQVRCAIPYWIGLPTVQW